MAQLTFPITPGGLCVDVLINVDAANLLPLRSTGGGPSPVHGRGVIDTGTDLTAVAGSILQKLGISPSHFAATQTLGGGVPVQLYEVSLHILDVKNIGGAWFSHPWLLVMGIQAALPVDVLVGLDVLRMCRLVVDGPGQYFTLDF